MCASFSFGVKGGMWDLIVFNSDHYLSIYCSVTGSSLLLTFESNISVCLPKLCLRLILLKAKDLSKPVR